MSDFDPLLTFQIFLLELLVLHFPLFKMLWSLLFVLVFCLPREVLRLLRQGLLFVLSPVPHSCLELLSRRVGPPECAGECVHPGLRGPRGSGGRPAAPSRPKVAGYGSELREAQLCLL